MKPLAFACAIATITVGAASAQTTGQTSGQPPSQQQQRIDSILGALFGGQTGASASGSGTATNAFGPLDAQWTIGRLPLAQQRAQFETRIDGDVRAGTVSAAAGARAKSDYAALVELEARYGADRVFTQQERSDLKQRYDDLTNVVAEGGAAGSVSGGKSVADGRADFEARVDEGVRLRRLQRTTGTQLKTQYADLVRLEADYMRDGVLSVRERDDLETKLDALDAKLGDAPTQTATPAATPPRPLQPSERLDAIGRALPTSGLTLAAQTQLKVEHEDLSRLAAAYRRFTPTADETAYLDKRLTDLETRARVRR